MDSVSVADWIVIAEFALALAALVTFVLFYAVSSRGEAFKSPEGRHLLTFRTALIAWMGMGIVHNLVDDYPGRDVVRIVVIGWAAAAAAQGTLLVIRAQKRRRATLSGGQAAGPRQGVR